MNEELTTILRIMGMPRCVAADDALEAQARRIAELEAALRQCFGCLERSDTSTGYCMCGSNVDHGAWADGHEPVDAGDYYAGKALEAARAALEPKEKV
jgi:hypothetical protein